MIPQPQDVIFVLERTIDEVKADKIIYYPLKTIVNPFSHTDDDTGEYCKCITENIT